MNSTAGMTENTPHSSNANSVTSTMGILKRSQKPCKKFSLFNRKTVTAAAYRLNQAIHFRRLQRGTQAADMHIHRAFLDKHLRAPHLIEQLRAAVHPLRVGHKEMQQAELGGSELNCCIPGGHAMRGRQQFQAARGHHYIRHLRNIDRKSVV